MMLRCEECGIELILKRVRAIDCDYDITVAAGTGKEHCVVSCLKSQLAARDAKIAELEAELAVWVETNDRWSKLLPKPCTCDLEAPLADPYCPRHGCPELEEPHKKIAELQGIVNKLPKTKDGVPITPYMDLWYFDLFRVTKTDVEGEMYEALNHGNKIDDWSCYYSTEEAAKQEKADLAAEMAEADAREAAEHDKENG